jgi:GntR family transcriptional regulator/MocR family aminotransferase
MKRAGGALLPELEERDLAVRSRRLALYRRIRGAILSGALRPGERLPSTRTLARDLSVSRSTAEEAFAQLVAEGFLERRIGDGTYVAAVLAGRAVPEPRLASPAARLSRRGEALAASSVHADVGRVVPFRGGQPDCAAFPLDTWRRLLSRRLRLRGSSMLGYGDCAGFRPLREAIASYLGPSRGVRCTADDVIVFSSSQQAIDLAGRLLLDPGDAVWMEEPGYPGARAALQAAGGALVPIPVDENGLDVAAGCRAAPRAKLAYVTPSHQYPLGAALSLERRLALLDWASAAGAMVLEDDYDSEFRYQGRPIAAIQGLDRADRVVYVGTFSKVLYPSLRLAYAVVPSSLADPFARARRLLDGHPPVLLQAVVADFIEEGHFGSHLRSMRALYAERRRALQAAVNRELAGEAELGPANAGLHAVLHLARTRDVEVHARALALGVDAPPLSALYFGAGRREGLVLGDAALSVRQIHSGISALAQAVAQARGRR